MAGLNRDIEIDDAKAIAQKRGWPVCLVICVDPETGDCAGASWGTDRTTPKNWQWACAWGGKLLESTLASLRRAMPVWQKKAREMKENRVARSG